LRYLLLILVPVLVFAQPDSRLKIVDFQSQQQVQAVNRLLNLGSYARAETILEQFLKTGTSQLDMSSQWISLWQGTGRDSLAVDLINTMPTGKQSHKVLRELAESYMNLGDVASAKKVINRVLQSNRGKVNTAILMTQLWRESGYPLQGVALCDSLIAITGHLHLERQRVICLVQAGKYDDAMTSLNENLGSSQFNLHIVRRDLALVIFDHSQAAKSLQRLNLESPSRLLLADLLLQSGQTKEALAVVEDMFSEKNKASMLYQFSTLIAGELRLVGHELQQDYIDWLLPVSKRLFEDSKLSALQKKKVLSLLAEVSVESVRIGMLDGSDAVSRLELITDLLQEHYLGDDNYFIAKLELAKFTCDKLHQPERAVKQLNFLVRNPGLKGKGMSLCKVELGRCLIAVGDTVNARAELANICNHSNDSKAVGMAHFILAKLDLSQGQWKQAQDRLSAVAMLNLGALVANDALDLGLLIAEEIENPVGGTEQLQIYARAVIAKLVSDSENELKALRELIAFAQRAGPDVQQFLLERARWELAKLVPDSEALTICSSLVLDHPDGRYPANALNLSAVILLQLDDAESAKSKWEQLLMQYPNNLLADDARQQLEQLQ
jgi:tetratricopeptide (TPR) repeat protein